jgi:hypothetical protein
MDPQNPALYYNFKGQSQPTTLQSLETLTRTPYDQAARLGRTVKLNLFHAAEESGKQMLTTQLTLPTISTTPQPFFRPSTSTLAINQVAQARLRKITPSPHCASGMITNYNNSFGNHNVKAMLGYSYQYEKYLD